jgi:O-antigen ligase
VPPETTLDRAAPHGWIATACALLIASVAWPPEIHPWSRALCHAIAAAVGLALLVPARPLRDPRVRWFAVLLPLAAASILSAACRSRALDEGLDAALLVVAGLLGRRLRREQSARWTVAIVLAALGSAVSVQAILQHFVTYPRLAASWLGADGGTSPDLIVFLKEGRPAGPFSLPAALGGFLALSLPQTLAMASMRRRAMLLPILAAACLQIEALLLTRSIGSVVALAAGLLVTLPRRLPGRRALVAVAVGLLATTGIGYFLMARGLERAAAEGLDPLSLRLGNWRAAVCMIGDHPLFGVGPGSFATFYGRYMLPGMNETRFAHNSYLQAVAVWGIWILFPMVMLLLAIARGLRPAAARAEPFELAALIGACAFLVHNLGDFTAYLPGVAIPGAILIGLSMVDPERATSDPARDRQRSRRAVRLALAWTAALVWSGHAVCFARARTLREAALAEADRGDIGAAVAHVRDAARLRPGDPEPAAFLAQLVLAKRMDDATLRAEGVRAIERALAADRESANLHYTRALYHHAAGETAAAYREILDAHRLFPLKSAYRVDDGEAPEGRP